MELTTQTLISRGGLSYQEDSSVLRTGDFKLKYKTQSATVLSCSIGGSLSELGLVVYQWNEDGPVFGPNGEWELDPDLPGQVCRYPRPAFTTCKNNCPGGELDGQISVRD